MSEITQFHRDVANAVLSAEHRQQAALDYPVARDAAEDIGLELRQCSASHYQLRKPGAWRIDLYPGKQRVHAPVPGVTIPPFLKLRKPWTLFDVVQAAKTGTPRPRKDEWEDDEDDPPTGWICVCGHYEESDLHCSLCGGEPPWGCPCDGHGDHENEEEPDYDLDPVP